jgi:hypothetical protein
MIELDSGCIHVRRSAASFVKSEVRLSSLRRARGAANADCCCGQFPESALRSKSGRLVQRRHQAAGLIVTDIFRKIEL